MWCGVGEKTIIRDAFAASKNPRDVWVKKGVIPRICLWKSSCFPAFVWQNVNLESQSIAHMLAHILIFIKNFTPKFRCVIMARCP